MRTLVGGYAGSEKNDLPKYRVVVKRDHCDTETTVTERATGVHIDCGVYVVETSLGNVYTFPLATTELDIYKA